MTIVENISVFARSSSHTEESVAFVAGGLGAPGLRLHLLGVGKLLVQF